MRNFDNRQSFLDINGKPIVGRVKFYTLHTTDYEPIFDFQGTQIVNPQFTNDIGQILTQVFLDDVDYTVYVEKYIGTGNMQSDFDDENWQFQYSFDNLFQTVDVNVYSNVYYNVNNISDLRNLNPNNVDTADGKKLVQLIGYNEAGDKPAVLYVWNSNSIENDNGGNIIKVNNIATGRWELVNLFGLNGVDVRHFGVFGAATAAQAPTSMAASITIANMYTNTIGIPLYFPSREDGLTWYNISGLTLNNPIFANNTRCICDTGSSCTLRIFREENNVSCWSNSSYNGTFTLYGPKLKASWGVLSPNVYYNAIEEMYFDTDINNNNTHTSFSNVTITSDVLVYYKQFTNCLFNVVGKLSDHLDFYNCKLEQIYFENHAEYCTVDDNCLIPLSSWTDVKRWLELVTQQSNRTLDLEGRTFPSNAALPWSTAIVKNANFNNANLTALVDVLFQNCTGSLTLSNNSLVNLHVDDSILTVATSVSSLQNFTTKKSTLTLSKNYTVANTIFISDSNIINSGNTLFSTVISCSNSTLNTKTSCENFNATKCTINEQVTTHLPQVIDCDIYAHIVQNSVTDIIQFIITNNRFYENGGHVVSSTIPNTAVAGKWINNISSCSYHFIGLDRTNLIGDEQLHTYVYEGNIGPNTLQKYSAKWMDNIFFSFGDPGITSQNKSLVGNHYGVNAELQLYTDNGYHPGWPGWGNYGYYLTECRFFSVGTSNIPLRKLTIIPPQVVVTQYNTLAAFGVPPMETVVENKIMTGGNCGIFFTNEYVWRIKTVCFYLVGISYSLLANDVSVNNKSYTCRFELG